MRSKRKNIGTSLLILAFMLLIGTTQPVIGTGRSTLPATSSGSFDVEFTLTGKTIGWLRSDDRLFRTENDGATWQQVTPLLEKSETLADVYFLDSNQALALALSSSGEEWQISLLKTTDAGSTWQIQNLSLPDEARDLLNMPFGEALLHWHNPDHGWVLIKQATSSNFSLGILLRTTDGGQTWAVSAPPVAEKFVFLDENVGFMRDPADSTGLYQTQDSGKSWQSTESLAAATALGKLQRVGLPVRSKTGGLLLPVWVEQGETEPELLLLSASFEPQNPVEASAWLQTARVIDPHSWQVSHGSDLAFDQISSFDGKNLWLGLSGKECRQAPLAGDGELPVSMMTCESKYLLLSSNDAGGYWEAVDLPADALPAVNGSFQEGMFQNLPQDDQQLNTDQWVQIYHGQGFDACEIPTLDKLQAWFNGSPYQVVNLYIGGISRYCDNDALTAAYLQQMYNQGWRFIPTWVGPQAPCTSYRNRFSWDPEVAYQEGVDNANQARDTLLELGLTNPDGTGSVVYDDLEYFTYSAACSAATRAFVRGWTTRLQELGIISGLYSSTRGLDQCEIYNLTPPPYVVWMAEWFTPPGYRPDVTVWDVDWLEDRYWSHNQRILQYSGTHTETWAGVSISMDNNVLEGLVAAPYGADLIAPFTAYSQSGTIGISPWYKTPVTVTLTATDNSSGVKHTYYRANQGTWNLYTGPIVVNWSGLVTIDYVSVDQVNNWEAMKTASFYVDSWPPVNPHVTSVGCQAWNGVPQPWCNDPNFTWAGAFDLGVGLSPSDTYEVYWGPDYRGTSGTRTAATQFNPPAIPTGVPYYLRIRTQDRHGLWSAW